MKLESDRAKHPQVIYESKVLQILKGGLGIPRVRCVMKRCNRLIRHKSLSMTLHCNGVCTMYTQGSMTGYGRLSCVPCAHGWLTCGSRMARLHRLGCSCVAGGVVWKATTMCWSWIVWDWSKCILACDTHDDDCMRRLCLAECVALCHSAHCAHIVSCDSTHIARV